MDITPELVKQVAINARLKLKDEEIKKFTLELKEILENFQTLAQADTTDALPSWHPIILKNVTQKDEPHECLEREKALSLTPHKTDLYFRGPKVT